MFLPEMFRGSADMRIPAMPAARFDPALPKPAVPKPQKQTLAKSCSRSEFETIKPLTAAARGGCNVGVLLVRSKRSGKTYIEKRMKPRDIDKGRAERELRALIQCKGFPNIVRIREYDLNHSRDGYGSLFMQYCELGSLDGMIKQYGTRDKYLSDEGFLWKVFWDVAIAFCHMYTGRSDYTIRKYAAEGRRIEGRPS
jgi:hypothetical protein